MITACQRCTFACLVILFSLPAMGHAQSPKFEKGWAQKATVHASNQPIKEVIFQLCEKAKIPVEFDASLQKDAVDLPISIDLEGISVGSAVDLICRANFMGYYFDNGKLLIFSDFEMDGAYIPRDYPLPAGGQVANVALFTLNLQKVVSGRWKTIDADAKGTMEFNAKSMHVEQTRKVHKRLDIALGYINALASGRPRPPTAVEKAEQLLIKKLVTPRVLSTDSVPLSDALSGLLKKNSVPYWVFERAMQDEGIDSTAVQVQGTGKKLPLNGILDATLPEQKLAWCVRNELVYITTPQDLEEDFVFRLYDISRLINDDRTPDSISDNINSSEELSPNYDVEGYGGYAMPFGNFLIVHHNRASHSKIEAMLR